MIDRNHDLPVIRQAEVLNISRGSVYYKPRPVSAEDLALMRRIDELHLDYPFAGSRMLRDLLGREGVGIGRRHVATLMKRMGIAAIYRRPNTSKPAPGSKIYPYLLRGVRAERSNQVWAMDITYIPMARGFVYLAAVVDWFSRRVLSHRVSITMEADFCVEALEEALAKHGRPEIFNTDQGSQFTSEAFTGVLIANNIAISMDGRARGATMFSSSGSGNRSSMRRFICTPTTASAWRVPRLADIWIFTTLDAHIRALTGAHRTRLTSIRRLAGWRHEFSAAVCWIRLRSGYALPASHPTHAPSNQSNPAEHHLSAAGNCSDNRSQLKP